MLLGRSSDTRAASSLPAAHAILAACLLERGQVDDAEGALAMPGRQHPAAGTVVPDGAGVDFTLGPPSSVSIAALTIQPNGVFLVTVRGHAIGGGYHLAAVIDPSRCAGDLQTEVARHSWSALYNWPNVHGSFKRTGKIPGLHGFRGYVCVYLALGQPSITTARASAHR